MKKYRVSAVYCGCNYGESITDTYAEACEVEQSFIDMFIEDVGEENYFTGNGDFCTYIEEIDV